MNYITFNEIIEVNGLLEELSLIHIFLRLSESWQRRKNGWQKSEEKEMYRKKQKRCLAKLEQAEEYLKKQSDIYMDLSQSAKKKRTYDRSNPAYKWVALAIVLMGGAAFVYGIYALTTHAAVSYTHLDVYKRQV